MKHNSNAMLKTHKFFITPIKHYVNVVFADFQLPIINKD